MPVKCRYLKATPCKSHSRSCKWVNSKKRYCRSRPRRSGVKSKRKSKKSTASEESQAFERVTDLQKRTEAAKKAYDVVRIRTRKRSEILAKARATQLAKKADMAKKVYEKAQTEANVAKKMAADAEKAAREAMSSDNENSGDESSDSDDVNAPAVPAGVQTRAQTTTEPQMIHWNGIY